MAKEAVKLSLQLANNEKIQRTANKLFVPTLVRRASVINIK